MCRSMASCQTLVNLFCGMFRRGKKLIEIPSYFNVFDVDSMHFLQISKSVRKKQGFDSKSSIYM